MSENQNVRSYKRKYLYGLILLMVISLICVAFSVVGDDAFDIARREVLIRKIGHEILLHSGDSTSRVLPVKKIAGNEYQLSFENAFTFQPEDLVNTTQQMLAKDPLASDYVVNVINCANDSVAYGYAIAKNKKDDILTCKGRIQPINCYRINIQFKTTNVITVRNGYLLGGLSFLGFIGFAFFKPAKSKKTLPDSQHTEIFTLGSMLFNVETRKLILDENTTDLTKTETRVLRIFALSPNETIERDRLQKEIWEDEGVIVGRSLDMFISKLRKKLEIEPNVNIVVIRGKGYKLEINT